MMDLISILICLGIQKYLKFKSPLFRTRICHSYCSWLLQYIRRQLSQSPLIGLIFLYLPAVIVICIIFALTLHFTGEIGTWIVDLVVLWLCLELNPYSSEAMGEKKLENTIASFFENVFCIIFWFILSPILLILYTLILSFSHYHANLIQDQDEPTTDDHAIQSMNRKFLNIFQWVPSKLLCLAFALISNFSQLFSSWLKLLYAGLKHVTDTTVDFGIKALSSMSNSDDTSGADLEKLLDRSILAWLIILLIFSIGQLL